MLTTLIPRINKNVKTLFYETSKKTLNKKCSFNDMKIICHGISYTMYISTIGITQYVIIITLIANTSTLCCIVN